LASHPLALAHRFVDFPEGRIPSSGNKTLLLKATQCVLDTAAILLPKLAHGHIPDLLWNARDLTLLMDHKVFKTIRKPCLKLACPVCNCSKKLNINRAVVRHLAVTHLQCRDWQQAVSFPPLCICVSQRVIPWLADDDGGAKRINKPAVRLVNA